MARGRRTDHTRDELFGLILAEGSRLMADVGFARFSARELARRIGYSVTTVIAAAGGTDQLVMAVNTGTFALWADALERTLAAGPPDRIAALVDAYFDFARDSRELWNAIYDHQLPAELAIPREQGETRGRLTGIVAREVVAALPSSALMSVDVGVLTRRLIGATHGCCHLWAKQSYALMEATEADARADALDLVRSRLAQASA